MIYLPKKWLLNVVYFFILGKLSLRVAAPA